MVGPLVLFGAASSGHSHGPETRFLRGSGQSTVAMANQIRRQELKRLLHPIERKGYEVETMHIIINDLISASRLLLQ